MSQMEFVLGDLTAVHNAAVSSAADAQVTKKIWRHDAELWKPDEANQKLIRNALGWLTVADEMIGVAEELSEFANFTRGRGYKQVMVCGMGGSSLCPEVLAQTFGPQAGYPELLVLDSTCPDVIAELAARIDLEHCLFVIASKSGTTTEPNVFYKFWYNEVSKIMDRPGENFLAITDPGSQLIDVATELGFQRIFLNQPTIGGRYSALSYFGMVPAALMGLDLNTLLGRAKEMSQQCAAVMPDESNPGLLLGMAIGECALRGRDKLTLVIDKPIGSLGLWIEQLIAESTGKEGKGILPVAGEELSDPDKYSDDRVFVSISIGPVSGQTRAKLNTLAAAGHPVIYRELTNLYDLGGEFFVWEFATACAGWRLGINPFDQPNVQESKDATKELLGKFASEGKLSAQEALATEGKLVLYAEGDTRRRLQSDSFAATLRAHLRSITKGDYAAFLCYFAQQPEVDAELESIRTLVRDATKCATTIGYGPRFLHSTGQLHKGGPDSGVFFQLTAQDKTDFPVPGEPYSFSILKQAQALGDFRSLASRGRRAVRIELGDDVPAGLKTLRRLLESELQSARGTSS